MPGQRDGSRDESRSAGDIGQLISIARGMFAAIVLVMIVTLVAEYLMTLVENRLAKWRPQQSLDTH